MPEDSDGDARTHGLRQANLTSQPGEPITEGVRDRNAAELLAVTSAHRSNRPVRAPNGLYVGPPADPDAFQLVDIGLRGGEGITWRARYVGGLTTPVDSYAVKQLLPPAGARVWPTSEDWSRWSDQRRVLQQLRHPHLVTVFDLFAGAPPHRAGTVHAAAGVEFTVPYLVMEWIEGQTLAEVVEVGGFPLVNALTAVSQLAQAVTSLHSTTQTAGNPMLHRDIKPENCILHPERGLVLVDLGSVRRVDDGHDPLGMHSRFYTAPEVLADPRAPRELASDLFALGAVAHYAAIGSPPRMSALGDDADRTKSVETLRSRKVRDPERFVELLRQMTARDPADRPTRSISWARELEDAAGIRTQHLDAAGRGRLSRRLILAAGVVGVVGAGGGIGAWVSRRPSTAPSSTGVRSTPSTTSHPSPTPARSSAIRRWAWKLEVDSNGSCIPAGSRVLVGTPMGEQTVAIDPEKGDVSWSHPGNLLGVDRSEVFQESTNGLEKRDLDSGERAWLARSDYAYSSPLFRKNVIYATTGTGVASAISRDTGVVIWRRVLVRGNVLENPVIVGGRLVTSGGEDKVFGLDPNTGSLQWTERLELPSGPFVPVDDKRFAMFSRDDGSVVIIDGRRGRIVVIIGGQQSLSKKTETEPRWPAAVMSKILYISWPNHVSQSGSTRPGWSAEVRPRTAPVLSGSRLVVGQKAGVVAIDVGTGTTLWNAATDGMVAAPPALTSRTVYAGCSDSILYAFDLRTGKKLWSLATDAPITNSPVIEKGTLYAVSDAGTLYATRDL